MSPWNPSRVAQVTHLWLWDTREIFVSSRQGSRKEVIKKKHRRVSHVGDMEQCEKQFVNGKPMGIIPLWPGVWEGVRHTWSSLRPSHRLPAQIPVPVPVSISEGTAPKASEPTAVQTDTLFSVTGATQAPMDTRGALCQPPGYDLENLV